MVKRAISFFLLTLSLVFVVKTVHSAIEAASRATVYGDADALARVEELEGQLSSMTIDADHPRIFVNSGSLPALRTRAVSHSSYQEILDNTGTLEIYDAFHAMIQTDADVGASLATNVYDSILDVDISTLNATNQFDKIARSSIAYDWAYNHMTSEQLDLAGSQLWWWNNGDAYAGIVDAGGSIAGETYHREEWVQGTYNLKPMLGLVALAGNQEDAQSTYLAQWSSTYHLGDFARAIAYQPDGFPFEGYYNGADGCNFIYVLKSAAGTDLTKWCRNAALYNFYRTDFKNELEVFHKGANFGVGGLVSLTGTGIPRASASFARNTAYITQGNPFAQWFQAQVFGGTSSFVMGQNNLVATNGWSDVAKILFEDETIPQMDITQEYNNFNPTYFYQPTAGCLNVRTAWHGVPVMAEFCNAGPYLRSTTSHADLVGPTWAVYRDGNLAMDSGVYDVNQGQGTYFGYQKNALSHNTIRIKDPANADNPKGLSNVSNPGGVGGVAPRTFQAPHKFGNTVVSAHSQRMMEWSSVQAFSDGGWYQYIVAEADQAYTDHANEVTWTYIWIPKKVEQTQSAYIIIWARVEAKDASYLNGFMMHFANDPAVSGTQTEVVEDHHYTYTDISTISSTNTNGTSGVWTKFLYPSSGASVIEIGGSGYEYHRDGSTPVNFPMKQGTIDRVESQITGGSGSWQEGGWWRAEVVASTSSARDYFGMVLYASDVNDAPTYGNWTSSEDGDEVTFSVSDPDVGETFQATVNKTGDAASVTVSKP